VVSSTIKFYGIEKALLVLAGSVFHEDLKGATMAKFLLNGNPFCRVCKKRFTDFMHKCDIRYHWMVTNTLRLHLSYLC
jgi:hypothetical protein